MQSIQLYLAIVFFFIATTLFAQQKTITVQGHVTGPDHKGLSGVNVYLHHEKWKGETDSAGNYKINLSYAEGVKYRILFRRIGYNNKLLELLPDNDSVYTKNVVLQVNETQLNGITVAGKSPIQNVRESAYNVVALDAKSAYNTTMELSDLLNKASGVKIRQSGGTGSNTTISLNGFTGRSVKLFMDGVPMDGFGSAFQLNNIPVNIADRIEVYKGVVPIEFGADALGGVINIVTNQSASTFVDASYSYGSFNTHKSNLSLGLTTKNGFSVQLNAFQNYSDNSYKVYLDKMLDVNTGGYVAGDYWVKRFNDRYRNETVMLKAGFVKKWWADRFFIGLTAGHEDAQIQNATTLSIVYGARSRSGNTILPSLEYEKRVKNLHVKVTANYNHNTNQNIDTAARSYNWYGQYMKKNTQGESGTTTLSDYYNNNYSTTVNLAYRLNDHHSVAINNVLTGYERKLSSSVALEDVSAASDTMRRMSQKNVLGLSYRYRYNTKWSFNLFGKHYYQTVTGPKDTSTTANRYSYVEQDRNFHTTGYGVAATYFLNTAVQLKASFERAYQLPTETQLFGDEVLTTANSALQAEQSMNYNLGATINKEITKHHVIYFDINAYYRWTTNFIRQEQNSRYGTIGYVNFGKVRNIGVDAEAQYYYKNVFMVGGTVTYMDLRNREKARDASSTTVTSATYNDRMPNIPYFYGNMNGAYYIHKLFRKDNVLSLHYTFNYVGMFYLNWESQGSKNTKNTLPKQLYHDFSATWNMKKGRYNVSLEALNFTNAMLYDNFSLQKPGRSFNVKLRYYFRRKQI